MYDVVLCLVQASLFSNGDDYGSGNGYDYGYGSGSGYGDG